VTSPEAALTGMKSRHRKWRHYPKYVLRMPGSASPPFFLL
jgi:hypothetical protein